MRHDSETVKIAAETTGLNAACYLHIDFGPDGRPAGVALSSPGKFEGGALDRLFGFVNKRLLEAFEPLPFADLQEAHGSSPHDVLGTGSRAAGPTGTEQASDKTPGESSSNSEVPER